VQAVLHALARRLSENDTRAEETLADLRHALAGSEPPMGARLKRRLIAPTSAGRRVPHPVVFTGAGPSRVVSV